MTFRKSGLLSLVAGLSVFGLAACSDDVIIPPQPAPATVISITPSAPIALQVGQQATVSAVITGGTDATVRTVTYTSSVPAVAAVNAQSGVVTAAAPGTTTITATSTADANLRASVQVQVAGTTGGGDQPAQITIASITESQTIAPVNPGNVNGQIDVTMNVDMPVGSSGQIRVWLIPSTGNPIDANCTQTFTGGAIASDEDGLAAVPVPVVCTINTARMFPVNDANAARRGAAIYVNDTYRIRAELVVDGETLTATSQQLTFNNMDRINLTVRTDLMTSGVDRQGLVFHAGSITVDARPAIYSVAQALPLGVLTETMIISLRNSAGQSWHEPATGGVGCSAADLVSPTPNCPQHTRFQAANNVAGENLWRAVFPVSTRFSNGHGVGWIEDRNIEVDLESALTVAGNQFSGDAYVFYPSAPNVVPVEITSMNPLRIDNLAPRVTAFNMDASALGCAPFTACYINDNFVFAQGTPNNGIAGSGTFSVNNGYGNVDFGVDRQTSAFDIVNAVGGDVVAAGVTAPTGAPESPTALTYAARVNVVDALGNARTMFSGTAGGPAGTLATAQRFGVDRTRPIMNVASVLPTKIVPAGMTLTYQNGTDGSPLGTATVISLSFADTSVAPAGPAGFLPNPLANQVAVTLFNAANPTGIAAAHTPTCAGMNCTVTLSDNLEGYVRTRVQIRDASFPGGNVSDSTVVLYLNDHTAPTVAGVTSPSTIAPNTPVTFAADMNDNVELGDNLVSLGYPNAGQTVTFYAHQPRRAMATFGPEELVTSASAGTVGSFTLDPLISSLQLVDGTNMPAAGNNEFVEAVNFAVRDMAGHRVATVCPAPGVDGAVTQGGPVAVAPNGSCTQRQNNNIRPNVLAGLPAGATPFNFGSSAVGIQAFVQNEVCRSTAAVFGRPCPAIPANSTVVTLQAEAHGAQGLFANPFTGGVRFYTQHANRWVVVEGAVSVQVIDDDVQNIRRWIYTLVTNTTAVPIGSSTRAVGIRGNAGLVANNTDRMVP